MAGRIQSPSSINTYRQCPRKYYYVYIKQLPTKPSIHLVRGTVVHETLEFFFERPIMEIGDTFTNLQFHVLSILKERWVEHDDEVQSLGLTADEINFYREETRMMIMNWLNDFWRKTQAEMSKGLSFTDAFKKLTPRREEEYRNEEYKIRGYIDAIHEIDGEVHIRDYKTSKHPVISEDYKLQLAMYALMYKHTHGKMPTSVGIFFLKHGEQLMQVNDELLKHADVEIRWVHERTQTDDIADYQKKLGPLCNYCDFYEQCFKQREITDF
jgi:putative RecB family exonuclease